jgi:hypothetical protein
MSCLEKGMRLLTSEIAMSQVHRRGGTEVAWFWRKRGHEVYTQ